MLIKIGGGTTPILCTLDVYLHADLERDMLEFENEDFQQQQLEKPWKTPSRERQSLTDDLAAWWSSFPHARRGVDAFRRVGGSCVNYHAMDVSVTLLLDICAYMFVFACIYAYVCMCV